jgi:dihydrofolate synthase / folylpolyglutamate synthase
MMSANSTAIWAEIDSRSRFGIKPGLERMLALADCLHDPHKAYRVIHIAGTNGKGTTAFMLEQGLRALGYKVGVYSSPHIISPLERVRIDGCEISEDAFCSAWDEVQPYLGKNDASYFELLTMLAFCAFRQAELDWVIVECGLGGSWDATNIVESELGIITSIGLDHTDILGDTIDQIATDKAGICRSAKPLLNCDSDPVACKAIETVCDKRGALYLELESANSKIMIAGDLSFELLPGRVWSRAAEIVQRVIRILFPDRLSAHSSIHVKPDCASWPGRFQIVQKTPAWVLDVAHNPQALAALLKEMCAFCGEDDFRIIYCSMKDKDLRNNFAVIANYVSQVYLLQVNHKRVAAIEAMRLAAEENDLEVAGIIDRNSLWELAETVNNKVNNNKGDLQGFAGQPLLVCGSFLAVASWMSKPEFELPPGL